MNETAALIYDDFDRAQLLVIAGERRGQTVAFGSTKAVIAAANLLFPNDYYKSPSKGGMSVDFFMCSDIYEKFAEQKEKGITGASKILHNKNYIELAIQNSVTWSLLFFDHAQNRAELWISKGKRAGQMIAAGSLAAVESVTKWMFDNNYMKIYLNYPENLEATNVC